MPDYRVEWATEVFNASNQQEAARYAWASMRRPDSMANVFEVYGEDGEPTKVDLIEDGFDRQSDLPLALLDALKDCIWQLTETAAYDDARKGEDPGLLETVAEARRLIAIAEGREQEITQ